MTTYVFVDDDQQIDVEISIQADSEKEARKKAWAQLTDEQKDACGCLTCVDEIN